MMAIWHRRCEVSDSTNVFSVSYDIAEAKMLVFFQDLSGYVYSNVDSSDFGAIVSSQSVGKTFQQLLRERKWKTDKLENTVEADSKKSGRILG
jgi:hypothetical protein